MDTWPLCVNPNFSNRIMGRVSELMVRDFISAVEGERRQRTMISDNAVRIPAMAIALVWVQNVSESDLNISYS